MRRIIFQTMTKLSIANTKLPIFVKSPPAADKIIAGVEATSAIFTAPEIFMSGIALMERI